MSTRASIVAVGARSPIGLNALQTSLVWRSGKLGPTASPWRDKREQTIGSVRAKYLPDDVIGCPRLVALAAPALREAVTAANERARGAVLLLATGEAKPGFTGAPTLDLAAEVVRASGVSLDSGRTEVIGIGHAGFAVMLQRALAHVSARRPVIVGAVDSYHHPDCMKWLDDQHRLHADGVSNGIIPSEGAAFIVLTPDGAGALARLVSVACGAEEGHEDGAAPDLGRALLDVVKRAGEGASARPIPWVLTDTNGERHRVRRWSFVRVRGRAIVSDETTMFDGPDELGDAGAAMGALLAAHVTTSFATGCVQDKAAMVALSSESSERGAFVLEGA